MNPFLIGVSWAFAVSVYLFVIGLSYPLLQPNESIRYENPGWFIGAMAWPISLPFIFGFRLAIYLSVDRPNAKAAKEAAKQAKVETASYRT